MKFLSWFNQCVKPQNRRYVANCDFCVPPVSGFSISCFFRVLLKWFIFEKMIILEDRSLTWLLKTWPGFILLPVWPLCRPKFSQSGCNKYHKLFSNKLFFLFSQNHIWWKILNITLESCSVVVVSLVHSVYSQRVYTPPAHFTQTHTFSPAKSNIHVGVHTNIVT